MTEPHTPEHAAPELVTDNMNGTFLSDKVYAILKWMAMIVLPGLATLYIGIAQLWGLPRGLEVAGTITLIDTFLGALLGLSTTKYNNSDARYDGVVNVQQELATGKKVYSLELQTDPNQIDQQKALTLKVNPQ